MIKIMFDKISLFNSYNFKIPKNFVKPRKIRKRLRRFIFKHDKNQVFPCISFLNLNRKNNQIIIK
jgi:hypothetical protein